MRGTPRVSRAAGLGRLTAQAIVERGHEVVVHARGRERLEESVIPGALGSVLGDLARDDETRLVAVQANEHGRFDAVIHNAGVMGPSGVYRAGTDDGDRGHGVLFRRQWSSRQRPAHPR
ncbi:SDR family NAD(P)-dependent oxidoreductase [Georgenia sp. Z1491]|uniref:SDR family NAD(P)-dependent oxidoreductase n=1 Tax=Georgenia sp. Z1491 TaxID=3416707 RepID=UPI003CEACF75